MTALAFDTSAAVPFLVRAHSSHDVVRRHAHGRAPVLTVHSLAETYSVLTRLPGDSRLTAPDAERLIKANFGAVLAPPPEQLAALPQILAPLGIAGGAVHDALVGLAVRAHDTPLLTRDARALGTYALLGVEVDVLGD